MEKNNTIQVSKSIDKSKGQKIVAALYLVTQHLTDSDPIKEALRREGVLLLQTPRELCRPGVERLQALLGAAALAGHIYEKNVAILMHEIMLYSINHGGQEILGTLFGTPPEHYGTLKRTEKRQDINKEYKTSNVQEKQIDINKDKDKRQSQILSFINDRKSAVIKDISQLFPNVSEKTIQRELGALVSMGKITKRGSKRWSIYIAVS